MTDRAELADMLRSIASHAPGLFDMDRERINEAADELDRLAAIPERLQLMAAAERETGRQAVHRAVAYETAAGLVAGEGAV